MEIQKHKMQQQKMHKNHNKPVLSVGNKAFRKLLAIEVSLHAYILEFTNL
jgi:hypothetical protein